MIHWVVAVAVSLAVSCLTSLLAFHLRWRLDWLPGQALTTALCAEVLVELYMHSSGGAYALRDSFSPQVLAFIAVAGPALAVWWKDDVHVMAVSVANAIRRACNRRRE